MMIDAGDQPSTILLRYSKVVPIKKSSKTKHAN